MSKKIPVSTAILLLLLAILATFLTTNALLGNSYREQMRDLAGQKQAFEKLAYVDELYRELYVGEIDEEQLGDYLILGYIAGVGDKYASYMTADQFAEYMQSASGKMVGVGVHVINNTEYDAIEVVSVMPDSPALEAGVQPGDLIYKVGDESVAELGYETAVNRMTGEEGTIAEFSVLRGDEYDESMDFQIERKKIDSTTVTYRMFDENIGIVKILEFASNTNESVKIAVEALREEGAEKLIFDVRYNPGGELTGIVKTLDYLLPEGPIIRIVGKDGANEEVQYSDANELDMPMAVLINENTASAAELFSCALQDYKKAVLVGKTTYGKGTMQQMIRLPDGSGVGISYKMYNPPYSENYEGIGVIPDYEVDMPESVDGKNIYKITDEEDTQLQKAAELLREQS